MVERAESGTEELEESELTEGTGAMACQPFVKGIFGFLGAPGFLGPSRDGGGNIHDERVDHLVFLGLGMEFTLDGRERTEDEITSIGHDGGAARWDATFGLVEQEAGKKLVDRNGGLGLGHAGGE